MFTNYINHVTICSLFQKERLFILAVSLWFKAINVVLLVHKPFDQQFNDAYFLIKVHLIYNSIDSLELI
jgi:hypothetical protein